MGIDLSLTSAAKILFWLCTFLIIYIYVGYPFLISAAARFFPQRTSKGKTSLTVSVVIACYNDAVRIEKKVRELLDVNGADQIIQILVGSDGSTDKPDEKLAAIGDDRVTVRMFEKRRGKPAVLNDLVREAEGDVLLMMDARQLIDPNAVTALISNFADETVGVVSGELVFVKTLSDTSVSLGLGAYWRYEKWIRKNEAVCGSVPGATGAMYGIRRILYKPMPADMVLDDVILPMHAVIDGKRCVFDSSAIDYDVAVRDYAQESIRKRRTIAGCIQLLHRFPSWCLPWHNPIAWQYTSHKILRIFSPFVILAALACSMALASLLLYKIIVSVALGMIVLGFVVSIVQGRGLTVPYLGILGVFTGMQVTILRAWWDFLCGKTTVVWEISRSSGQSRQI